MAKPKFKKNQVVIHKEDKTIHVIVDSTHIKGKGHLYTLHTPNVKNKTDSFKRYYEDKLQEKCVKMSKGSMAEILYKG